MQGRFHLKVKERITGVIKKFPGFHLSITAEASITNYYYVEKEDTRIRGPWKSDDIEVKIPWQMEGIIPLPWQQQILDDANIRSRRTINILLDKVGNIGKTILVCYAGIHRIARTIPFRNDYRDMIRMVMDAPKSKMYMFDIPRSTQKDKLYEFFAGIETLKGGYAFDDRYKFREEWFDAPNIWIFTNTEPDRNLLSPDRWKIWEVINGNLVEKINNPEEAFVGNI